MSNRTALWNLLVSVFVVGVGGCGDDASTSRVTYPFTLGQGDGIELVLEANVRTAAVGVEDQRREMIVNTTLDARCTQVTASGERRLRFTPREFTVDGKAGPAEEQPQPRVLRIGPDRSHRGVEIDGKATPANTPASNPFVTGGFLVYLPMPSGGMAIGDTYELARDLPDNVLPAEVEMALRAAETKPAFRGIYTLRRTFVEGGALVGEFDIELSLTFDGAIQMGTASVKLTIDMQCRGSQAFELYTGLATGAGVSALTQRIELGGEGFSHAMRTSADVKATARPLSE